MDPSVTAGTNFITVSGIEPGPNKDEVQVTIIRSNGKPIYNEEYDNVPPGPESQSYKVPPDTYQVNVYSDDGNDLSIFNGVTVPPAPSSSLAHVPVKSQKGATGFVQPVSNPRKHNPPFSTATNTDALPG